jgi:hypothetical protein
MKPKLFSSAGVAASDAPAHRGSCYAFGRRWIVAFALTALSSAHAFADRINGQVLGAGAPIVGSTVTLWAAGTGAPQQLAQTQTGADGGFVLDADGKGAILYLVAKGGRPAASKVSGENPALALIAVLGSSSPGKVVINELTTVASAFTAARFINGEAISGNPLGLRISAGNVPNFVDLSTGGWGKVLLDPLNSSMTTTMANLDTLGSLITAYFTVANDDWRGRFLKAATPPSGVTPKTTLEAIAGIARAPWAAPKELYGLYDEAYPLPAPDARRSGAPFAPYFGLRARRLRPLVGLLGWRGLRQWAFHVRCRRQSLERPKLVARLAVRRQQKHRRRGDQIQSQRDSAFSTNHRLYRHGY